MRFIPDRKFLYPVLQQDDDDYPEKSFVVEVSASLLPEDSNKKGRVDFNAKYTCDVSAVNNLVNEGSAVFLLWVYCGDTSYRDIFKASDSGSYSISGDIPVENLIGTVEFHPQIITTEEVTLDLSEANPVYPDSSIILPVGSPLAVHKLSTAEVDYDDSGTTGIFRLERSEDLPHSCWEANIDLEEQAITLLANQETYSNFQKIRKNPTRAIQTLYLAALVETLAVYLNERAYEIQERDKWTGSITNKLGEINIEVSNGESEESPEFQEVGTGKSRSTLWVAQRLLGDPLQFPPEDNVESENT